MASTQRLRFHLLLTDNQGEVDSTSLNSNCYTYSFGTTKLDGSEHDSVNTGKEEDLHLCEGNTEEEGAGKDLPQGVQESLGA